ncbi:MAG: hypothetical protein ACOY3P_17865 [Planctomycetota bacterium]
MPSFDARHVAQPKRLSPTADGEWPPRPRGRRRWWSSVVGLLVTAGALSIAWVLTAQSGSAASDPKRDAFLEAADATYSEEHQMLGTEFSGPGYHTTIPDGTWVHPTRQSFGYAVALLSRNAPGDEERAARVFRKLLRLQDTNPKSRTYGIWPWLLEEPLERMSPPDWNWADFCGAQIATALVDYGDRVPEDLVESLKAGLGHAARAIRKRNVQPSYTNIAIIGGGVCAAAGELLREVEMLAYGRDRLQRTVEHARRNGSLEEYNSPTYTMVALYESERILHLVRDSATREAAEALRRVAWGIIADSFHPGTGQWAGPHSRTPATGRSS